MSPVTMVLLSNTTERGKLSSSDNVLIVAIAAIGLAGIAWFFIKETR